LKFGQIFTLIYQKSSQYFQAQRKKEVTTKYLAKFQSPRAITWPKIIGPEQNVNLICSSSLYTNIPKNQVAKYLVVTILFHYDLIDIDLIFGICVYNDELQIKFTFRFGPMIFGRVMQSS
jgi:hypothetical protein